MDAMTPEGRATTLAAVLAPTENEAWPELKRAAPGNRRWSLLLVPAPAYALVISGASVRTPAVALSTPLKTLPKEPPEALLRLLRPFFYWLLFSLSLR
jgi:hypothetical protein